MNVRLTAEGGHVVAAGEDCEGSALCAHSQSEAVAFEARSY